MKTEIIGIQSHPARNSRPSNGRGDAGRAKNDRAKVDQATARKKSADPAQLFSKAVEHYAMYFERPEARLRFLNNTRTKQVERQAKLQNSLRRFRFLKNTRIYGWLLEARCYSAILEELRAMAPSLPKNRRNLAQQIQAPFSARLFFLFHQSRHAFYGALLVVAGLMLFGVYSLVNWSAGKLSAYLTPNKRPQILVVPTGATPSDPATTIPAKYLPYKPEAIWKYEDKDDYEVWSNNCRILKEYETDNRPRSYLSIPRGAETDGNEFSNKIVGIIYHTPESGIVPFIPDNNEEIQKKSRRLLEYVRERKLYNYMIGRYGAIYRIVRDDQAADHAGHSIWADAKNTYVALNDSFIGVCFESKFDGAESVEEILTPAQINSGRLLTDVLRTKYSIDDANCTTHGLVAVDEKKMLIARHHDWVRNFPFDAMGLSDKYKIHPPSMVDYGCTYNEDVLAKLNYKLWPGALTAEEEFNKRAEKARASPDDLRRKLQERYNSQCAKARALRAGPGDANNPQLAEKPSGAGEPTESGND